MKRCRRCHSEVNKKETHCTSCGLKLGLNSTYWSGNYAGKGKLPNYGDGSSSSSKITKKNTGIGCIIFIFIAFYICAFFFGIVGSIAESIENSVEENYERDNYSYKINVEEVEGYLYNTKLIAEDYYKVWTYANEHNLTLDDITKHTSLKKENLSNVYCKLLEQTYNIGNVLSCVNYAHDDIGTYNNAYDELSKLYNIIVENEFSQVEYDTLVNIYAYGIDLYYIIYDYKDYKTFKIKYNEYINELESLIEELSNISV